MNSIELELKMCKDRIQYLENVLFNFIISQGSKDLQLDVALKLDKKNNQCQKIQA